MNKKILLVDDQNEVLEGTRDFLTSIQIPAESILLARDGQEGISLALSEKPDVIVTDIMMPGLDGLLMIEKLRNAGVSSRMIVLSAYSEFSFAKQAISLGVSDYLVKPVTQQQICTAVMRQLNSFHDATGHDVFCGLLLSGYLAGNDFYSRPEDVMEITGLSHLKGELWTLALVEADALSDDDMRRIIMEDGLAACEGCRLFHIYGGPCLIAFNFSEPGGVRERLTRFTAALSARDASLRGGLSGLGRGIECLPGLYHQAMDALARARGVGGWQGEPISDEDRRLISLQDMEALARAISDGRDEAAVWRVLDELLAKLTLADADQRDKCEALQAAMCALCERFGVPDLMPTFHYEDRRSLFSLKQQSIGAVRKLVSQEAMPHSFAQIRKAVEYINQNFAGDCSVTFLANYVNFSYAYFSSMFARVMGIPATEYVLSVRLENAERMLTAPGGHESVGVIAQKCGFENPRYFSTCFKNRYGKNPSEY